MKRETKYKLKFVLMIVCLQFVSAHVFSQQKPWVAPASSNAIVNPIKGNKQVLADAKTIYMTNCSPCHGPSGKGNGVAAAACNPKPADHTSAKVQSESDGSLFWKIAEGRGSMPSFKQSIPEAKRWELVNFIRSLAKR